MRQTYYGLGTILVVLLGILAILLTVLWVFSDYEIVEVVTPTNTATFTPTSTATPTATPTDTPTNTPTNTSTATATNTPTPTPTFTTVPTYTPYPTYTSYPTYTPGPDPETEFLLGVDAACRYANYVIREATGMIVSDCRKLVDKADERDWFGRPDLKVTATPIPRGAVTPTPEPRPWNNLYQQG